MTSPADLDIGAPGMGDNVRDFAAETESQLSSDYAWVDQAATALLEEARALPKVIETDEDVGETGAVIKRLRDHVDKLESLRVTEKEPHLRRGNAVDSWFNRIKAKFARSKKTDNPGAIDILQARIQAYQDKIEAAARAAREAEARRQREEEDRLRREREAQERAMREAEEKAARARKAENVAAAEAEAARLRQEADRLAAEEAAQRAIRREAEAAAAAKTADLVRTRHAGGVMTTSRQVPYVELVDRDKLDLKKLLPHFKEDHLLAALKSWAKSTNHKVTMDGAVIEMRSESVVR